MDELCTICNKDLHYDVTTVKVRGLSSMISKSKQKNDGLWKNWENKSAIKLHDKCRKRYGQSTSSENNFSSEFTSVMNGNDLRSEFSFLTKCFLCSKVCDNKKKRVCLVLRNNTKDYLMSICDKRDDEWGRSVKNIIENVSLRDVQGRYHKHCYTDFRREVTRSTRGRPENYDLAEAFKNVCEFIDNSADSQFQLSDLHLVMGDCIPKNETLINKLTQHYGSKVIIMQNSGKQPIICMRDGIRNRLSDSWYRNRAHDDDEERKRIVKLAADLIRSEIREKVYDRSCYPSPQNFIQNVQDEIPELLQFFVSEMVSPKHQNIKDNTSVKCESISHSIMAAVRPNSFTSSLHLAVGSYVYQKTASKLLIELLSKLGMSVSYYNVLLYEASAIMNSGTHIDENAFCQYIFDNVDHNPYTLDGRNSLHDMGGIISCTPRGAFSTEGVIPKLAKMPTAKELAQKNKVKIVPYGSFNTTGLEEIIYKDTASLNIGISDRISTCYSTYLWAKSEKLENTPIWHGFMELLSSDFILSASRIVCLPFIRSPPSNLSTINTSLHLAAEHSRKRNQGTCFVTFDQPLYIKARSIVGNASIKFKNTMRKLDHGETQGTTVNPLGTVIVRLGGFHLLMSYLGSIGNIMLGSGIEDLWALIYAPGSVGKMLSGHAYARSVRFHTLLWTTLGILVTSEISDLDKRQIRIHLTQCLANEVESLTIAKCDEDATILSATKKFIDKLELFKNNGLTAQLWVQYFDCVTVMLQFIEAERCGNWDLHLQSVRNMLPFFHAGGHFAYAKSAQIYLQDMVNLKDFMNNDEEFVNFISGGFTICRSERNFAGVWSDMTIEQTLMRDFKAKQGLTHGRGTTPSVQARFIQGRPYIFDLIEELETYCDMYATSSEQHVDLTSSRMKRDNSDIETLLMWLKDHNPFNPREDLMSLSTGLIGRSGINCHEAKFKGDTSMRTMIGKPASEISLSLSCKVKSLAVAKSDIHEKDENFIAVNSALLFQRIFTIIQGDKNKLRSALDYELSPFPLSLFDSKGLVRKTPKSKLYTMFKPVAISHDEGSMDKCYYVIDGGFLLHKVVWPIDSTYDDICESYVKYIRENYGHYVWVVFDGYNIDNVGTKSYERYTRGVKKCGAAVAFERNMATTIAQSNFLSNTTNKDKFVSLLTLHLHQAGVIVSQAEEDADRLIVKTAIEICEDDKSVVVVGNDVDLLVLLTALTPANKRILFQKTVRKNVFYAPTSHIEMKDFILFAHAFSGCDTTSSFFNKGKKIFFSLTKKLKTIQERALIFNRQDSTHSEVIEAAKSVVCAMYSSKHGTTTTNLRYDCFMEGVRHGNSELRLANLPPTETALKYHAYRVYYQVQQWYGNDLNPEIWGWKKTKNMLMPIMTTMKPAPDELIKLIFCGCEKTNCTKRCKCKSAGLQCTDFCKQCNGESCNNPQNSPSLDFSEDDGDNNEAEELNAIAL